MKKAILGAISGAMLIVGVSTVLPIQTRPEPAAAQQASDKYDGECTGYETVGRCADKCPEGSYSIGTDENGAAICKQEPTGCPYGDSIPMDMCDKFAPQPEQPKKPAQPQAVQCGGK